MVYNRPMRFVSVFKLGRKHLFRDNFYLNRPIYSRFIMYNVKVFYLVEFEELSTNFDQEWKSKFNN